LSPVAEVLKLIALFTQVPRSGILRSHQRILNYSIVVAGGRAEAVTPRPFLLFIGNSSLIISMGGMENGAGPCPHIRRKGGREHMKRACSRPAIPICSAI
jgi:hypothetical protein